MILKIRVPISEKSIARDLISQTLYSYNNELNFKDTNNNNNNNNKVNEGILIMMTTTIHLNFLLGLIHLNLDYMNKI